MGVWRIAATQSGQHAMLAEYATRLTARKKHATDSTMQRAPDARIIAIDAYFTYAFRQR